MIESNLHCIGFAALNQMNSIHEKCGHKVFLMPWKVDFNPFLENSIFMAFFAFTGTTAVIYIIYILLLKGGAGVHEGEGAF